LSKVDAYQEDSKYLRVRYVMCNGEMKAKFLGTAKLTERGVTGTVGAIKIHL